MAKKNDPNNFKFPTTVQSDSFTDFLNASLETERLLPIEKTQIRNEPTDLSDVVTATDITLVVISDGEETETSEVSEPTYIEGFIAQPVVPVDSVSTSSIKNLSQYAYAILNDPSILTGKTTRVYMAVESHTTIKVIHQTLVQHGVYITMPRLLDFIIQGHAETITHLIKSLKKQSSRSK